MNNPEKPPHDFSVTDWLAHHDAPCPVCDYHLRGVPKPSCPECGAPLRLAIDCTGLTFRAWLTAVIAVALGLGFDGVIAILIAVLTALNPPPPGFHGPYIVFAIMGAATLLSGAGLYAVIATRRRWLRRPRRVQWRWATLVFLLVFTAHAALGVAFFLTVS